MSYPRLLGCRSLPLRHFGSQRGPRTVLVFWGTFWGTTASVAATTQMWFHSSTTLSWTPWIALVRRYLAGSWRTCLLWFGQLYCVEKDEPSRDLSWTRGWHFTKLWQTSMTLLKEIRLPLLRHMAFLNHLCRKAQHLQLEPWAPTWKGRRCWKTNCWNGILWPFKKHLIMLNTTFFKNDFTSPTIRAARFSSTRTRSSLTSDAKSFYLCDTRRGVQDQIVEGEQAWVLRGVLSRAIFRRAASERVEVLYSVCLYISATCTPKKKGIAKKLIQTFRAIMISQEVDLVAGDFNVTAWRCRKPWQSQFHWWSLCWWPGSIPDNWADVCGFLTPPGSQRFRKVSEHGAVSIPRKALGLRPNDQSCHHGTWLHLHFVDWNNKWSHQAYYNGNIRLKERPAGRRFRKPTLSFWLAARRCRPSLLHACKCNQIHFTRHLFSPHWMMYTHIIGQECVCAHHTILTVVHLCGRVFVLWLSVPPLFLSVCLSYPLLFSSHFYLYSVLNFFFHVDNAKAIHHWHWSPGRIHFSETAEIIFQEHSSDKDAVPSYLCDGTWWENREQALFTTVHSGARRTGGPKDKLITLLKKVCYQLSPFLCVTQVRGDPCMNLVP